MRTDYACLGKKSLNLAAVGMKQAKCPECGKKFMHSSEHVYRREWKFYCSWTCYRREEHRNDTGSNGSARHYVRADQQKEAAKALVEKCLAKVRLYTERANNAPTGTNERACALKCAREWRSKLEDAREYRRQIGGGEEETENATVIHTGGTGRDGSG